MRLIDFRRNAEVVGGPTHLALVVLDETGHLRRAVGMPIGLPAFSWMVRLGAPLVFRTDPELALYGRYVVSKRLAEEGFEFQFTDVGLALQDVMGRGG